MKEYPLISVLVPAYNHEKYVEKTLNNIMCEIRLYWV